MATAVQKIKLSPSRDIPFNKLVLSQSNVRRVKAGVSIEQLAESIALRTMLQSLSVRAVVDADGQETGMFEVPAGGRRYRALELLVKQKRMAKTQPVPCVVRNDGIAEDDSFAENDERLGLHQLDQFRAFQVLHDGGMSEEDIAARHFVTSAIVKQRLRLASVSPKLHEVYAGDGMTLEQLMAFSVTADQTRQEQVWDNVSRSQLDEPYQIRRMLYPDYRFEPSPRRALSVSREPSWLSISPRPSSARGRGGRDGFELAGSRESASRLDPFPLSRGLLHDDIILIRGRHLGRAIFRFSRQRRSRRSRRYGRAAHPPRSRTRLPHRRHYPAHRHGIRLWRFRCRRGVGLEDRLRHL
jgi:ParB/RepB/Spo0J family partition protein